MKYPAPGLFAAALVSTTGLMFGGIFIIRESISRLGLDPASSVIARTVGLGLVLYSISVWVVARRRLGRVGIATNTVLATILFAGSAISGVFSATDLATLRPLPDQGCGLPVVAAEMVLIASVLVIASVVVSELYCLRARRAG